MFTPNQTGVQSKNGFSVPPPPSPQPPSPLPTPPELRNSDRKLRGSELKLQKYFGSSLKLSFYELCDLLCKPVNNAKFEK